MTAKELGDILPYVKGAVIASTTDRKKPPKVLKAAMIETILAEEGLGASCPMR